MRRLAFLLLLLVTLDSKAYFHLCEEEMILFATQADGVFSQLVPIVGSSKLVLASKPGGHPLSDMHIFSRENLEELGSCSVRHSGDKVGIVAIAVDDKKREGIATEAEFLMLKYAFDHGGYERIDASITLTNSASMRLHEKLGFKPQEASRSDTKIIYTLTRDDFEALTGEMRALKNPRTYFVPRTAQ